MDNGKPSWYQDIRILKIAEYIRPYDAFDQAHRYQSRIRGFDEKGQQVWESTTTLHSKQGAREELERLGTLIIDKGIPCVLEKNVETVKSPFIPIQDIAARERSVKARPTSYEKQRRQDNSKGLRKY